MNDIQKLWSLTGEDISNYSEEENPYFDPLGLILFKSIECLGYWCTPSNTVTFATTGGDGVHYGILKIEEKEIDQCPVVMTLPSADEANIILGENFREFLSIGCRSGYFSLEQLTYQRGD